MDLDRTFITKFNELHEICKKLYPNQNNGFDAIRTFATYAVIPSDKQTLLNLIDARNTHSHDKNNLIHFDQRAIYFTQGLIDGANRRFYNNFQGKIDSNLENLRTSNLNKMSSMLKNFDYTYKILDNTTKSNFKNRLKQYIDSERTASGLENIKKYYFDFKNFYSSVKTSDEYKKAVTKLKNNKRRKFENDLKREKEKVENSSINAFENFLEGLSFFQFGKKKRVKEAMQRYISLIKNARNFDDLDEITDSINDFFETFDDSDED